MQTHTEIRHTIHTSVIDLAGDTSAFGRESSFSLSAVFNAELILPKALLDPKGVGMPLENLNR